MVSWASARDVFALCARHESDNRQQTRPTTSMALSTAQENRAWLVRWWREPGSFLPAKISWDYLVHAKPLCLIDWMSSYKISTSVVWLPVYTCLRLHEPGSRETQSICVSREPSSVGRSACGRSGPSNHAEIQSQHTCTPRDRFGGIWHTTHTWCIYIYVCVSRNGTTNSSRYT